MYDIFVTESRKKSPAVSTIVVGKRGKRERVIQQISVGLFKETTFFSLQKAEGSNTGAPNEQHRSKVPLILHFSNSHLDALLDQRFPDHRGCFCSPDGYARPGFNDGVLQCSFFRLQPAPHMVSESVAIIRLFGRN
jgi:hypothetical protein